jgi:hypothetical protein
MSKTTDNGLKRAAKRRSNRLNLSDFWCLTPFSAISQLNHGNQSLLCKKLEYPERTTDHGQAIGKS